MIIILNTVGAKFRLGKGEDEDNLIVTRCSIRSQSAVKYDVVPYSKPAQPTKRIIKTRSLATDPNMRERKQK